MIDNRGRELFIPSGMVRVQPPSKMQPPRSCPFCGGYVSGRLDIYASFEEFVVKGTDEKVRVCMAAQVICGCGGAGRIFARPTKGDGNYDFSPGFDDEWMLRQAMISGWNSRLI